MDPDYLISLKQNSEPNLEYSAPNLFKLSAGISHREHYCLLFRIKVNMTAAVWRQY